LQSQDRYYEEAILKIKNAWLEGRISLHNVFPVAISNRVALIKHPPLREDVFAT
jgi:hypothetical protein